MRSRAYFGKEIDIDKLDAYNPEFWSLNDDRKYDDDPDDDDDDEAAHRKAAFDTDDDCPDEITIYLNTDLTDRDDLMEYWDNDFQVRIYHNNWKIIRVERWSDFRMCGGQGTDQKLQAYPSRALEREAEAIMADIVKP